MLHVKKISQSTDKKAMQLPLPNFWPDRSGLIKLPDPRAWKRHVPRRRSFAIWLLSRASGAIGFGPAREFAYRAWLERELAAADFNALTVREVINGAQRDLELDLESSIRYLAKATAIRGGFRSDGQIVTFQLPGSGK